METFMKIMACIMLAIAIILLIGSVGIAIQEASGGNGYTSPINDIDWYKKKFKDIRDMLTVINAKIDFEVLPKGWKWGEKYRLLMREWEMIRLQLEEGSK